VAYVRFASVYREFKDVTDFVHELQPILRARESARQTASPPDLASQRKVKSRSQMDPG
jgi:transcriptional repressor NrdR